MSYRRLYRHAHRLIIAIVAALIFGAAESRAQQAADQKPQLWLYYSTNLLVDKNIDQLKAIWQRAAAAGYTHVLLSDSKFGRLGNLGENRKHYFANLNRTKQIAADLHLQLIPALFGIGYSNDLLGADPNLAEGLPVRDALFVVKNGQANIVADPPVALSIKPGWKDDCVAISGGTATIRDNPSNARMTWDMMLPPFRCYHISVQIRADHYSGQPEIKAIADTGRDLQYKNLSVKSTQDWTQYDVVFNTLTAKKVTIYLGVWGSAKGQLHWRNWKIEEAGLTNVLRRPGTPLVVKNAQTGQVYVEGRDFEKVSDPRLGDVPWGGEYEVWHAPPAITTHLPDGTRLRVSWYHPVIIYDDQVAMCFAEPEAKKILADQAQRVKAAFGASGYMMSHDEIRVMGWDEACGGDDVGQAGADEKFDAGKLLADDARYCTQLLTGGDAANVGKAPDVYVWSDMFDPYHNAHDKYYLVRGNLAGSWEGLDKSVIIVNWNFGQRDKSLKFFADRGHRQVIAGYYDADVNQVKQWLESAAKVRGVIGVMYTTWQGDYRNIEAFAKIVRESN